MNSWQECYKMNYSKKNFGTILNFHIWQGEEILSLEEAADRVGQPMAVREEEEEVASANGMTFSIDYLVCTAFAS